MTLANVLITVFSGAAILAYLLAAARHFNFMTRSESASTVSSGSAAPDAAKGVNVAVVSVAIALHAVSFILNLMNNGGLGGSFYEMMSLTALTVMLVALPSTQSLPGLVVPLSLVAAVSLALYLILGAHKPIDGVAAATSAHIALSLVAYGVLCIASIAAAMLYLGERGLRSGSSSVWLGRIPPLQAIETLMFRLIAIGWLCLTAGLAIGFIAIDDFLGQHLAHKTVFSLISWVLFGALLLGRWQVGWRGTLAVRLTLIAFALLAVAFLGSKFVLDVLLNRL